MTEQMSERAVAGPESAGRKPPPQGYSRLYGPMAVIGFAITFVPLFGDVVIEDEVRSRTVTFESLWVIAGQPYNGGQAGTGLLVIWILVALLLAATFRPPRTAVLPIAITLWSLLPLLMLTTKYGMVEPVPPLSDGGLLGLGMLVALLLVGLTHSIHLLVRPSASRGGGRTTGAAESER